MMKNKIIMFRLYNGDYIIGEENPVQDNANKTSLLNPRIFALMPSFSGQVNAGFHPVCMFSKDYDKEVSILNDQIWLTIPEDKLMKEVIDGYNSEVSGIDIASPADLMNLDKNATKTGEFVI